MWHKMFLLRRHYIVENRRQLCRTTMQCLRPPMLYFSFVVGTYLQAGRKKGRSQHPLSPSMACLIKKEQQRSDSYPRRVLFAKVNET